MPSRALVSQLLNKKSMALKSRVMSLKATNFLIVITTVVI